MPETFLFLPPAAETIRQWRKGGCMPACLNKLWDTLRTSYWFVPSLMTGLAVALGALDAGLQGSGVGPLPWLYRDSLTAARTLLLAVAGATIGLIGVVFSITMVPLTIAASQLGPRLLRTFLRDTGTQIVQRPHVRPPAHPRAAEVPTLLRVRHISCAAARRSALLTGVPRVWWCGYADV